MSTQSGAGTRWLRGIVSLAIVIGAFGAAWFIPPQLGLDLSGGTQIVLETRDGRAGTEANAENTDQVIEVLRERIDGLGVSEATMSRSGENRIIVELPGVQDPTEAAEILGQTAQLTFHPVLGVQPQQGGGMQAPGGGIGGGGGDSAKAPADEARAPTDGQGGQGGGQGGGGAGGMSEEELQQLMESQGGQGGGQGGGAEDMTQEQLEQLMQGQGGGQGGGQQAADPDKVARTLPDEQGNQLQLGESKIEGDQVASAEAVLDPTTNTQWQVNVDFRGQGQDAWADLTGQAACNDPGQPQRRVAIVLDDEVISSPEVNQDTACDVGQTGGSTTITSSSFDQESANDLAVLIEGGSLPLPVTEVQRQTVGPTLGADAIKASFIAGAVGLLLTGAYICVAYRLVGFLAAVALACYTLIAYAALVALSATLTLPGLAGFVLAIGMAIDANVLIFERAREEYQQQSKVYKANKSAGMADATDSETEQAEAGVLSRRRRRAIPPNLQKAFLGGTQKAWSAVLDTNITTLIAAALLFFFASGTVRGFGVTLGLGTIASMVSALVIARVLVEWAVRRKVVRQHPAVTGISRISRVRTWLIERNPDLMSRSKLWLGIAAGIAVVAVAGVLIRTPDFGVEFTGGRVMDFTTEQDISVSAARDAVTEAGHPNAVVQESGDGDVAVRTGPVSDAEAHAIQDALSEEAGNVERLSDEKIGPSMGDELRNRALIALVAALALQMVYLAWRFRWSFGVSTMLALAFDITLVIGLFTWLGRPIDGVFLAAILSVIGFSVNDSVVVFDRVRDEWANDSKSGFRKIANTAILHTIPRTVNTTIGGVFILGTLAIFGGSSLRDFAVAMLIGLISGVFSTVFVAAPLAAWLQRWDKTPAPHVIREKRTKQRKELRTAREQTDGAVV
ncbi:preprotein translocase subunit SecD [Streptomonospora alba]|uniref:Multifunctional fusion protein n=1 Tax=Streptomonospora alba TaxID=183763 RepID=A0A0C2JHK9_9ACTN|nr:protein translocase subunit SecD [Streptomonospora alba]KIH96472.1 preprotein translocase subunit SecD [Streptomonospora alba]